ncbi:MAG: hypothetical protein Q7Q71_07910 [Verrucomicrobiota bacterium JB023]|nr:hypothetical protein [Verrucomicrobiota bacterium JB023]
MKENYEKVLLGLGVVVAIVLGVFGFLSLSSVDEEFGEASNTMNDAEPIRSRGFIDESVASLTSPPMLSQVETAQGRSVDLFTSVPYYVRKGEEQAIDLLAPGAPVVHPPIPNEWWITHKIDPGFGDSPQRDEDGDGFSNLEEYEAETNPTDENSFPSLFAKVKVSDLKETKWLLKFTDYGAAGYSFKIEDTNRQTNRISGGGAVKVGERFFPDGPYAQRFLYQEKFTKEERGLQRAHARVEDLKPGKEGTIYEIPNNNKEPESDFTATFYLDTPDQKGNPFDIDEGMSFALPYDEDAEVKPFTFKEVQDGGSSILLLWESNGETKELKLSVPQ